MKKLSTLIVAFLLTAGMAYAQNNGGNDAAVTQTGDNQTADVSQTGATNFADVDQFTDNSGAQTATVIQDGTSNQATISQSQLGIGHNSGNSAYIEQIGITNSSTQFSTNQQYQSKQELLGFQNGTSNVLTQNIFDGHENKAIGRQEGTSNELSQTHNFGSRRSTLEAEQDGSSNTATQISSAEFSYGEVYQTGHNNTADQTLAGGYSGYGNSATIIGQIGDQNYASQDLFGTLKNNAVINQEGFDNKAWQNGYGEFNARLTQTGDGNKSWQTMTGESNTSIVTQTGNMNISNVTQTGDMNTATVTQSN